MDGGKWIGRVSSAVVETVVPGTCNSFCKRGWGSIGFRKGKRLWDGLVSRKAEQFSLSAGVQCGDRLVEHQCSFPVWDIKDMAAFPVSLLDGVIFTTHHGMLRPANDPGREEG